MRLDHLLSKEQLHRRPRRGLVVQSRACTWIAPPAVGGRRVCGVVLEGGTLTSSAGSCLVLLVPLPVWGVGNVVRGAESVVGTLLGPEGTGPPRGLVRSFGSAGVGGWGFFFCPGRSGSQTARGFPSGVCGVGWGRVGWCRVVV